jgi:cell division protein FtsB
MSSRRPSLPHRGSSEAATSGATPPRGVPTPRGGVRHGTGRPTSAASRTARGAAARPGARGASTRPASRTVAGSGSRVPSGTAVEQPLRVPRMFTIRAMVLFVVLLMAFVLLFPTVRAYLAQEAENRALAQEVADARQRTDDLSAELERWHDEAYVVAQARERLAFVRPGETAYRVVDPEVVPDPTEPVVPAAGSGPALAPTGTTEPWYSTIWESARVAGEAAVHDPAATPTPTPGAPVDAAVTDPAATDPAVVDPAAPATGAAPAAG